MHTGHLLWTANMCVRDQREIAWQAAQAAWCIEHDLFADAVRAQEAARYHYGRMEAKLDRLIHEEAPTACRAPIAIE